MYDNDSKFGQDIGYQMYYNHKFSVQSDMFFYDIYISTFSQLYLSCRSQAFGDSHKEVLTMNLTKDMMDILFHIDSLLP